MKNTKTKERQLKLLLRGIFKDWQSFRNFFHGRGMASFFSIIFYVIYAIMQLILKFLLYLDKFAPTILFDYFSFGLLFILGIERYGLTSRYNHAKETIKRLMDAITILRNTYSEVDNQNKNIMKFLKSEEKNGNKKVYIAEIYNILGSKKENEARGVKDE